LIRCSGLCRYGDRGRGHAGAAGACKGTELVSAKGQVIGLTDDCGGTCLTKMLPGDISSTLAVRDSHRVIDMLH
jgi:uncharacterized membrane protein